MSHMERGLRMEARGGRWEAEADSLARGGGGVLVGEAAQEAAPLVQCVLGEVRVGKGMVKGQVVIRLAEVVACRRRKQAKRVGKERRALLQVWMGYSVL